MLTALIIIILLVCILLALIVLVQNPKGGGLSSTFGGVSNQILGASRSSDFVEKATWILGGALMVLCLVSGVFYTGDSGAVDQPTEQREYENLINQFPAPTNGLTPGGTPGGPGAGPAAGPQPPPADGGQQ